MPIDPEAIKALRILAQALFEAGHDFVLIGAIVPFVLIDVKRGAEGGHGSRETHDVDSAIRLANWDEFRRVKDRLLPSGFRPGSAEHQLRFGEAGQIDLIPYGPGIVEGHRLVWPESGQEMTVLGLEEAFSTAELVELAPGLQVRIASIPALVLLKVAAYQDRHLTKDLLDIVYCLEHYEENIEGSRRFEASGVRVDGQDLTFDEAGAYLIGRDIASIASQEAKAAVRQFVGSITDEYAPIINQVLGQERPPNGEEDRRRVRFRLFRAMAVGLG